MKNKLLKSVAALTLGAVSAFALAAVGCGGKSSDAGNSAATRAKAVDNVLAAAVDNGTPVLPENKGPAAGPTEGVQDVIYKLNGADLPVGSLEEKYDDGIFSLPKGTTIRGRTPADPNPDKYSRSIQNGTITINVPLAGKLKFVFASGSSTIGNAKYKITKLGVEGNAVTINTADKVLNELEIDVQKGQYKFETAGGTVDMFGMVLTLKDVQNTPYKSIKLVNTGTTDYLITQDLDCTGVQVVAVDENDFVHAVDVKNCTFDTSAYNPNASGEYQIGVTYHLAQNLTSSTLEFSTTYNVKVYAVDSIKLDLVGLNGTQVTAQQAYLTTDTYAVENNLSVVATCDLNGDKITYKLKKDWYSLTNSLDLSTAGKKTVTVTVNSDYTVGNKTVTADYEVVSAAKKEVADNKVTVTVGANGEFSKVTQAVQYLKKCNYAATVNKVIEIEAGTYAEKIWLDVPNVTLVGKGAKADDTVITCSLVEGDVDNLSGGVWGLNCATVHVTGANFKAYNVAIRNDFDYLKNQGNYSGNQAAQGLALTLDADGAVLYNCHLYGNQDTLFMKSGRSYYYKTQIDGNVDFIFGDKTGLAFFEECKIVALTRNSSNNGYVTAAKHEAANKPDYGYIFYKCELTDDGKVQAGSMALGRPWGAKATVAYIECSFSKAYSKTSRWASMGSAKPEDADFCEYGSTGEGAINKAVTGGKLLTEAQAANYTKANIFGKSNGKVGYTTVFDCDAELKTLKALAGLDVTDPQVSITTATTATAGDVITVAYTASDDRTATADLAITVTVTKDGNAVTLTDNKFTAEEGVYTVTVTVRDAEGNEASDTIQITVSAKSSDGNGGNGGDDTPVVPPATTGKSGCGSTSVGDAMFIGGASLMGIGILFATSRVLRKKKED